ncbi:MAG: MFS transporter [Marinobacter sp.]|uniref:MFS transporter n=1 Tax=Marinobacter sp. TaxID=50741 RepID=UPI003F9DE42D
MTEHTPQQDTPTDPTKDPIRWRILAVVLMAIVMSLISVSVVNVALASIQEGLGASQSAMQWVLSGYALTFGVVLVSAGRAGDLMGRGGFFILGASLFTLASVAAGLAPDTDWLNAARFVQGVGSGFLNPQGIGLIQQYFRGPDRGRAFGYFGTTVGFSVAVGPVLGGLLIELGGTEIGWRLTFLINVPVGLLTIVLAWLWFPRPLIRRPKNNGNTDLSSLDPIGALLLASGVLAVLYPFVESDPSGLLWLLLPAGLLLFYLWVLWERWYTRRGYSPMVDLKIFATNSYRNGSIIMMLYFFGMTSVWVLVPLYLQQYAGFSAFEAGVVSVPSALLSAYSANWAGKRVNDYGRKVVIGGLVMAVFGVLSSIAVVLLHEYAGTSVWWLLLSLALFGLGQGSVISPNQTLTLAEVPLAYAGSSGAIVQTGQRIGTSVGIAVITAIVFAVLPHSSWPVAVSLGFTTIALIILLALIMAWKDLRDRRVE